MKKLFILSAVGLMCGLGFASDGTTGVMNLPPFVTEEGVFEAEGALGHVQGMAISDDAVYCGLVNRIMKFDLKTGRFLKAVPVPTHTGDVCWRDGLLYTSVAAGVFAGKDSNTKCGIIQVFDAELNLVREKRYPMIFDGITELDGILYLGYGEVFDTPHKGTKIVRVKRDSLELIDVVDIDPDIVMQYGVQSMATDGKNLILSFYADKMAVYSKDFKLLGKIPGSMSTGLDFLPKKLTAGKPVVAALYGFKRKDINGIEVPGYVAWFQYYSWDGEAYKVKNITPREQEERYYAPSAWLHLFNGKDLSNWTPKIRGFKAGVNAGNTFRVIDGWLCNRYDDPLYADGFKEHYGHLFYNGVFSNYVLKVMYCMPLPQAKGGPGWAIYNNGVMLHGQKPETMALDQSFPVSIELQLLSRINPKQKRPTANLCTPGTNVERDGKLWTPHTLNSTDSGFDPKHWTVVEAEVRGGEKIIHKVNGKVVLEYEKPQYDPKDETAKPLIAAAGGDLIIRGGTISIQSESAPTDFKYIMVKELK